MAKSRSSSQGTALTSNSPAKKAIACDRLCTGMTCKFSTTAASLAFAKGTTNPRIDSFFAASIAIDNAPLIGRAVPSNASSPTTAYSSSRSADSCPLPASTPKATGKSNDDACLGRSPGAKLITTRSCGLTNPLLTIARSTRCVLSFTAVSGSPTKMVFGMAAGEISTSTSTGNASMPESVNVFKRASMMPQSCKRRSSYCSEVRILGAT